MAPTDDAPQSWWRDGIIYQIYPRSFADANGDGIGDLRGIIEHLDYLNDGTEQSLGVDGIWLSPIHPSPMYDFGYDVSDFRDIGPEFGTLDDFRELVEEAHKRGIRIVMDVVFNHTSHEHPWFVDARSSRDNPKRDWYIWRDGAGNGPPNNWMSVFGGRAWTWDAATEQYYLHMFLPEQPDLNWRNAEVREALYDTLRYWLDLGVDGFRLDVADRFFKDEQLRDNPTKAFGRRPYDRQIHEYDMHRPETIAEMREIRRAVDAYPDRMTVGEVWSESKDYPGVPARYLCDGDGLHMVFNFGFTLCKWNVEQFAAAVEAWEGILGPRCWPNYTFSNHDIPRAYTRYAVGGETMDRARVAAAMLLTLRGTPFLYYGEEIGMRNGKIAKADLQDPVGKRYWPAPVGRDGERTPMQWSAAPHAGFTAGTPWLPVNSDYAEVNVDALEADPTSLLHWYRRLIHLRKREPALHRGTYRRLGDPNPAVLAYLREWAGDRIAVVLNFDRMPHEAQLPLETQWRPLFGSSRAPGTHVPAGPVSLSPYEVLILKAGSPTRI